MKIYSSYWIYYNSDIQRHNNHLTQDVKHILLDKTEADCLNIYILGIINLLL